MENENNKPIELRKVCEDNLWAIAKLSVAETQKSFVATTAQSIMQAYVTIAAGRIALPFGIYAGDEPIGFVMFGFGRDDQNDPRVADGNYCIWRFLIDQRYQRRGYGRAALSKCLEYLRGVLPCGPAEKCWLDVDPRNAAAIALYHALGFYENGETCEGELVMETALQ